VRCCGRVSPAVDAQLEHRLIFGALDTAFKYCVQNPTNIDSVGQGGPSHKGSGQRKALPRGFTNK